MLSATRQHETARYRIAAVSPFIDKRHGTERRVAEWISRLGSDYDVHVYSGRLEDLDISKFTWHRVPQIPGPHLIKYLWWFVMNQLLRWWDSEFRGIRFDIVYSPGINCLDSDVISVHIVFAEFYRQVRDQLSLRRNALRSWPRLLHRIVYYRLVIAFERIMYSSQRTSLILIARKTQKDLNRFYGRKETFPVVYLGLDHGTFNPEARKALRSEIRKTLGLKEEAFVLLLIGNDWKKKGLRTLLEALERLRELSLRLLVVGKDDPYPFQSQMRKYRLDGRVHFLPPRADVVSYYAAADAYVGPSLEDTYAQPPAEAMACGLPVITSLANGTSEIITDGIDGLILRNPTDAAELAAKILLLFKDPDLCRQLGEKAAQTARQYTWQRNGEQIRAIFEQVCRRKQGRGHERADCGLGIPQE